MSNTNSNLKILMELRPAFEGFAGIPQETRLLFSLFQDIKNFEATGLINQYNIELAPGLKPGKHYSEADQHKRINILSRHVVSHKEALIRNFIERIIWELRQRNQRSRVIARTILGIPYPLTDFDASEFRDFIWRSLFSKSLSVSEYNKVTSAKFAILRAPWSDMHRTGLTSIMPRNYPKIITDDYDIFISQTPYPGRLSAKTKLVVRYHDAIPIFMPHTIPDTSFHQHSHFYSLKNNQQQGYFACTSNAVREDLLKLYPRLEKRSDVLHDIVSPSYFIEESPRSKISEIIKARIEPDTQPDFLTSREKMNFYKRHSDPASLQYLMMVSTIEPRKNHMALIGAWQIIREKINPDLKLIIVGRPGWSCGPVLNAMKPWQERGELFNLSSVPSTHLRALYNGAEAVVCPSVAEGFDLSGIEAMLSGGAVIASDIAVHKEVYGDGCEYFNPYSVMAAAQAIERVIHPDHADHKNTLIEQGLKNSVRFQAENVGKKWETFFEKLKSDPV